jgi:ribose transport system ATP-binding protein
VHSSNEREAKGSRKTVEDPRISSSQNEVGAVTTAADGRSRVEVRNLSKTFPGMRALDRVDLDIRAGEIHALVGGNGSGKSTLIKILTGTYQGDPGGTLRTGEREIEAEDSTPQFAREVGIHVVHQDLGVFTDMSVAENIALGHGYDKRFGVQIRWGSQRRRTRELIERFQIEATPRAQLSTLSQSVRTQVAIARAMQDEEEDRSGLLILDEPTASLPAQEVDLLLSTLREYADRGQAILYVSHHLREVLELADRITVLRDGHNVGTYEAKDLDEDSLIGLILGRQLDRVFPAMPAVTDATALLEVRGLGAGPLSGVDLRLAPGEVVGIAGLLGTGRTELLRAIFGDLPITGGEILFEGEPLKVKDPGAAMRAGIAYVPENRAVDAAFGDLPVFSNISMANILDYWGLGHIAQRRLRREAREKMDEYMVKAAADSVLLSTLSGGNQQKVIVARWLRRKPKLLLLDEPTQGVDVGARAEIYSLLRNAVDEGASALVVASDFEELAQVSDRVVVLGGGRVTAELRPPGLSAERLMSAANQGKDGMNGH